MKTDIRKMIAEAYELEGLLLLADNRGADTPEYVFTAIGEKLDRLQMLLGEREGDEGEETQEDACMVENDVADAGSEEPVVDAPESEEPEPEPEEDVAEVTAEQVADGEIPSKIAIEIIFRLVKRMHCLHHMESVGHLCGTVAEKFAAETECVVERER